MITSRRWICVLIASNNNPNRNGGGHFLQKNDEMKRYLSNIQIGLLVFFFSGCQQNSPDRTDGPAVIDFLQQVGNYQPVSVSEFVSELEYIPLETGENCFIGEDVRSQNTIVTKSHIFVTGTTFCYAFSRDGKFITEIGRVGQGPGEYSQITDDGIFIDEKKQSLYMIVIPFAILEYSWDGVFRRSIKLPKNTLGNHPRGISLVRDSIFIGHNPNYSGDQEYHFFLFDTSGKIIKTFDNHVKIARSAMRWSSDEESMKPFRFSDCIYVKERPNDTLYYLNEQDELVPQFVFNLGKYSYDKKRRANPSVLEGREGVIFIPFFVHNTMVGASNHIFFSTFPNNSYIPLPRGRESKLILPPGAVRPNSSYGYPVAFPLGIYDTVNKTTRLLDTDPVSRMSGLINDLDGGLPFWPVYCNSDYELVDMRQAYTMKEDLTEEYFADREIKNPQAHQKLRELLKTLKDDDNPVVVIAKLK